MRFTMKSTVNTSLPDATTRFRVEIEHAVALIPGKVDVLERIAKTGSIAQAGRTLGMSYQRVRSLVAGMNADFVEPPSAHADRPARARDLPFDRAGRGVRCCQATAALGQFDSARGWRRPMIYGYSTSASNIWATQLLQLRFSDTSSGVRILSLTKYLIGLASLLLALPISLGNILPVPAIGLLALGVLKCDVVWVLADIGMAVAAASVFSGVGFAMVKAGMYFFTQVLS